MFSRQGSLFNQCLRLVSYAVRTLPHLWLRAFRHRSSLPSLCRPTEGVPLVPAVLCEAPAENDHGRVGAERSRLLDVLSLTANPASAAGRSAVFPKILPLPVSAFQLSVLQFSLLNHSTSQLIQCLNFF
jgi:hypothetical protein